MKNSVSLNEGDIIRLTKDHVGIRADGACIRVKGRRQSHPGQFWGQYISPPRSHNGLIYFNQELVEVVG